MEECKVHMGEQVTDVEEHPLNLCRTLVGKLLRKLGEVEPSSTPGEMHSIIARAESIARDIGEELGGTNGILSWGLYADWDELQTAWKSEKDRADMSEGALASISYIAQMASKEI